MFNLTKDYIQKYVSDSPIIYRRGLDIYENGSFMLKESNAEQGVFVYEVDGNYGDYTTRVRLLDQALETSCDCPYPGRGCKHTVAVLLETRNLLYSEPGMTDAMAGPLDEMREQFLTADEIRAQALDDRRRRARTEEFLVTEGEMIKGSHLVETRAGRQYVVTLHDPLKGRGHCSCPDYLTNRLGTCKHLIFLTQHFKRKRGLNQRLTRERFPFFDIFWESETQQPRLFSERPASEMRNMRPLLTRCFDKDGRFVGADLSDLMGLLSGINRHKGVRVQDSVLFQLERYLEEKQLVELEREQQIPPLQLKAQLYPYQESGIRFSLFRKAALIGDEMGLGKTLQAIALAILKKKIFGFSNVLVVTMASLKEQWRREIERFSDEQAVVVAGPPGKRRAIYEGNAGYFKITNYEALLRDVTLVSRFKPDLVILDEAQRIKNFSTKTADAVKRIPKKHALVLTGTPLENRLEDVYSIVQFLDPHLLTPLWQFAADHFMISRKKRGKIQGYCNLDRLHEKLKPIVIRRKKEEVLSELPEEVQNNYFVDLHEKQRKIHQGYLQALLPLINKKFLTPMDLRRIQEILLRMRMVCNSTYLIDRKTHISPKLSELESVIDELVVQSGRKMVIFSEWTTMTFLIGRHLSEARIPFVELSGKIPVNKRQALIDEFTHNPDCRVFLSTDAGGTGLNLQAADCVVNFELPWNPARLNQRVGRVSRIGQKSRCVNVVNIIAKDSIEDKIMAGLQLKTDLFKGVFEGTTDIVEFTHEKRTEMLNQLREMMGEEPLLPVKEGAESEAIPEDTPYYLNPEVLGEKKEPLDVTGEETAEMEELAPEEPPEERGASILSGQPPEKVEAVLNSGLSFISGLMEMATGQKISATEESGGMVKIDRDTGEVTVKFKLPGF